MSRKFIATVLAASLAVTSISAVPAKAGGDELVQFLAGATALVIIGNALDGNNSRDRVRAGTRNDDRYGRQDHHGDRHRQWGGNHPRRDGDRWGNGNRAQRDTPRHLPAGCLVRVGSRHHSQQVFGKKCLKRHYTFRTANLPQECKIRPRGENAPRRAYSADCLFARGYFAGRR